MIPRIKHAVDEYWRVKGHQPKYIGLGKLEMAELTDYLNGDLSLGKPRITPIIIAFGKIYGVYILPIDRETFFEVL